MATYVLFMLHKVVISPILIFEKINQKLTGLRSNIVLSQMIYHSFDHAKVFVIVTTSRFFHETKNSCNQGEKVSRDLCLKVQVQTCCMVKFT